MPLAQAELEAGDAYVFLEASDVADIGAVDFSVDGSAVHTENAAPYDLAGTDVDGNPLRPRSPPEPTL